MPNTQGYAQVHLRGTDRRVLAPGSHGAQCGTSGQRSLSRWPLPGLPRGKPPADLRGGSAAGTSVPGHEELWCPLPVVRGCN